VTDENVLTEEVSESNAKQAVSPNHSRFLFVDIAAARAKQLRRGALPRIEPATDGEPRPDAPRKPERIAMEEVRRGLVQYDLPELKHPTGGNPV
jgi:DNA-directed RNA polymerase subunit K/omega